MFSENRYPPRIKCGAGFFGIMHSCAHASGSGVFIGAALVRCAALERDQRSGRVCRSVPEGVRSLRQFANKAGSQVAHCNPFQIALDPIDGPDAALRPSKKVRLSPNIGHESGHAGTSDKCQKRTLATARAPYAAIDRAP